DVLFEHELERVRDRLEPPMGAAHVVGADPRLHSRRELALEERRVGDHEDDGVQDDERPERGPRDGRQGHAPYRSTSPKTGSTEPMTATTSATLSPGTICGSTAGFAKDAPRHLIRAGPRLPPPMTPQPTPPRAP